MFNAIISGVWITFLSIHPNIYIFISNDKGASRQPPGIGLGVAMMMSQAGVLMGAASHAIDIAELDRQIRKAKAEGRTVSLMNGALYFDYNFYSIVPAGANLNI